MEELLRQILSKLDNMEKGFLVFQEETRQRFEQMDGRLTEMNGRLVGLEREMGAVKERLDRVETRLKGVEARLDGVEARLDGVEFRLDGVETELMEVKETLYRVETQLVDDVQILLRKIHEKVEEKSFEMDALNRRLHHAEAAIEQLQSKCDPLSWTCPLLKPVQQLSLIPV
ncbi:hypothetical protein [Geobacillus stearothermophilus]|uniref:hypothetical protein n=1 Tax=Geobacillus stearothermophilus TaxID=1422 RepID=UPI002E24D7BA|nr:hypothetical protein [Geobacillus stearothermophilus]